MPLRFRSEGFSPVKGWFGRMTETKVTFHPVKSLFGRMKHSSLLCIDGVLNGDVVDDAFFGGGDAPD